jgi:hypothetical protein
MGYGTDRYSLGLYGVGEGDGETTLTVTATMPQVLMTVELLSSSSFISTQTWNRAGGRARQAKATVAFEPEIATIPAGRTEAVDRPFAKRIGTVTIDERGNSVYAKPSLVRGDMLRYRIVIDGSDVTFFRGVRTPVPDYEFIEPFGYGPAVFTFESIGPHEQLPNYLHDDDYEGDLDWCAPDAPVKIQLVYAATDTLHSTVWHGFLDDFSEDGNKLQVIASGLWSGDAALRDMQLPLFGGRADLGRMVYHLAESVPRVQFTPRLGPVTGIEIDRFGGMRHLDAINYLLQRAQTLTKGPYTILPEWGTREFSMFEKDTETIDATFYADGQHMRLQRNRVNEPDRIYGYGVTPGGQRVRNGRYPGLLDDPDETIQPAPYPFDDGRVFGVGTDNGDTDTGDGITIMLVRLQTYGLLAREDVEPGVYNEAAAEAVYRMQQLADILIAPAFIGDMTEATWAAMFAAGRIGQSIWWSKIEPMAQKDWTRKWRVSPDGTILGKRSAYKKNRRMVDKTNNYGVWRKAQMLDFAEKELEDASVPMIFGELEFDTGGLLRGSVDPGDTVTDADFMDAREVRSHMNIRLPHTRWGDIVVHVATTQVRGGSGASVTAKVATRPVDSAPLWEILNANQERRRDTSSLWWRQNRSSNKIVDSVVEFDEVGGQINPIRVEAFEWKVFKVLAGQIGMIERLRLRTEEDEGEFVLAVFGLPINAAKLNAVNADPLNDKAAWIEAMNDLNDDHRLLYLAGEPNEPAGYSPGTKSEGHELTGVLDDRAGFAYKTSQPDKFRPWLYFAVQTNTDGYVVGGDQGRIIWNQELVGL